MMLRSCKRNDCIIIITKGDHSNMSAFIVIDFHLEKSPSIDNFAEKEGYTMQSTSLNNAQLEILDMMSFVKSQEVLADLKQVISNYFASELEKEMNRLWETGEMTEEKVEGFRNLHERTPYK